MILKEPLKELPIKTANSGFYAGFSQDVTITAKLLIGALIIWTIGFADQASAVLKGLNTLILKHFAHWYIWVTAIFVVVCIGLSLWPAAGKLRLGAEGDRPEFSNFSWFSMMFGAGIGVGMLTWSVAEPLYHFSDNPDVIQGITTSGAANNLMNAYKWSFLHWGFTAWACYAICGLALAFFSYRHQLPLTIRSSLAPLFGSKLSGSLGHLIDTVAVVATVLGVAQTLGFGVEQFVSGLARLGVGDWLMTNQGNASSLGIILAIAIIMGASTLSALSGVGKGIKWLSNLNMALSIFLLGFFLLFGASFLGLKTLIIGSYEYLVALPALLFTVWEGDGQTNSIASKLATWQSAWTVFYWAWWVAFAPFVGLFLARISKGRTIREFVLGAVIVPSMMCFIWFTWVGGTAIELESSGVANGLIQSTTDGDKIFALTGVMLDSISPLLSWCMAMLVVILLLTYLVTSADSAVLIINTINAGGDEGPKARPHIIFWGIVLALVVAALLMVGGLSAIQTAMVIGALPFSLVMLLMCISLIVAITSDTLRHHPQQHPN